MKFEWDAQKADSNLKKHGVTFPEAATVLSDALSTTYYDPDHSAREHRFITIGTSLSGRLLMVAHTAEIISELLAQENLRDVNENIMKKANKKQLADDLRPEYDLAKLKGGVRGKYAKRFRQGTNLVLLSPDIAKYFPDDKSVNDALRSLVGIAKAKMRHAS